LASMFGFFGVLSLLGILVTILPPGILRRVAPIVRTLVLIGFVILLSTSYAFSEALQGSAANRIWARWLPACWFLCLLEILHGRTTPALAEIAPLALPGLGLTIAAAFLFYALGYRRYFLRMAEMTDADQGNAQRKPLRLIAWFDQWILRTPFQQGCFHF